MDSARVACPRCHIVFFFQLGSTLECPVEYFFSIKCNGIIKVLHAVRVRSSRINHFNVSIQPYFAAHNAPSVIECQLVFRCPFEHTNVAMSRTSFEMIFGQEVFCCDELNLDFHAADSPLEETKVSTRGLFGLCIDIIEITLSHWPRNGRNRVSVNGKRRVIDLKVIPKSPLKNLNLSDCKNEKSQYYSCKCERVTQQCEAGQGCMSVSVGG